MTRTPPTYLTVPEVAAFLRVSKMTIYRAIDGEDLRAYRIGRSLRVDTRDLEDFLRRSKTIAFERPTGGAA